MRREDLVDEIRERTEQAWEADAHNREAARRCLRFIAGEQWTDEEKQGRQGRPTLTINKLPTFVRQVANDIRRNKPSIKVIGVDESDTEIARIYDGLIRAIEYRSSAQHVYATAAAHVASCGLGHFRVRTEYVDDASFEQDIRLERIADPLSVYWDPAAVRPDRADATWCVILEQVPMETFRARYPGAREDSVEAPDHQRESPLVWSSEDYVLVAEYWRKVPERRQIALVGGQIVDITGLDRNLLMAQFAQQGYVVDAVREVTTHRVESYIASGAEILSGPHPWAGKYIPIITVVGEEIPVGDQIVRRGVINDAIDPQRLYNYWRSAAAEVIGQAPKSPWLVTKKMITRFRDLWDRVNREPAPYLVYDPDPEAPGGRPTREAPPAPPSAMWQEAQIAADDIKATTGIFDASLGARGNETSGKAILARQQEGDTANYHIVDNLSESMAHAGRILVDLIPRIYDTERVVRILGEDDSETAVRINQRLPDGSVVNDLSVGRFDVRVSVGPSYATRRSEAAESMMQFAQAVPGAAQVIGDLIAKNMDWPGADQIAARLRKMLPPGLAEDGPERLDGAGMMAGQPPQPPMPPPVDPAAQQAAEANSLMTQLAVEEKAEAVRHRKLVNDKLAAELEQMRVGLVPGAVQNRGEMNATSAH